MKHESSERWLKSRKVICGTPPPKRHGLGVRAEIVDKMAAALSALSRKAADPPKE
jgi:hypothetical protein